MTGQDSSRQLVTGVVVGTTGAADPIPSRRRMTVELDDGAEVHGPIPAGLLESVTVLFGRRIQFSAVLGTGTFRDPENGTVVAPPHLATHSNTDTGTGTGARCASDVDSHQNRCQTPAAAP